MDLGDRMKGYESCFDFHLPRKSAVIVRVDGRAFHTFTRNSPRPFSQDIINEMVEATRWLANEIQGFRLAYTQSDEASLWFDDRERIESEPWFCNSLSKILSLSASIFGQRFGGQYDWRQTFDARAFILPRGEVPNYFLWRARDWNRNSIQMLAREHFSHKQLNEKSCSQIHEMLHKVGVNWADLPSQHKNGTFIDKSMTELHEVLPQYAGIKALCDLQDASAEA